MATVPQVARPGPVAPVRRACVRAGSRPATRGTGNCRIQPRRFAVHRTAKIAQRLRRRNADRDRRPRHHASWPRARRVQHGPLRGRLVRRRPGICRIRRRGERSRERNGRLERAGRTSKSTRDSAPASTCRRSTNASMRRSARPAATSTSPTRSASSTRRSVPSPMMTRPSGLRASATVRTGRGTADSTLAPA